jgi:hypothetical protein
MNKPHKHADLIKAWADGAEIEIEAISDRGIKWYPCDPPHWATNSTYRIKPEPKPDVVRYGNAPEILEDLEQGAIEMSLTEKQMSFDTTKFTYDGETGKLKSVEMV